MARRSEAGLCRSSQSIWSEPQSEQLKAALELPNGASFYRCALQVNPYAYLLRHNVPTPYRSEAEYNAAIIEACITEGIKVIGVTDHYRVDESRELIQKARDAGLVAFLGFEAYTKDGVHFLCLFDQSEERKLASYIVSCSYRNGRRPERTNAGS